MAPDAPELAVHKEWLGQIQQVGLVVSPYVLAKHGVGIDRARSIEKQTKLREIASDAEEPRVDTFLELVAEILDWPSGLLAGAPGGPEIAETLTVTLPEYNDRLFPTYAIPGFALISVVATGADLDRPPAEQKDGWRASPHARLERLLRETGVPIGLLFNHTHLRLVYAPKGESSGHLTFRFRHLLETLGRPMVGALDALLGVDRVTDILPDAQRLPALLQESRKYQNVVSTKLAGQVLAALWELLRGFQRANDETKGELLAAALRENPQEVYGGLLSTLMRLVFILYAEDRGLMPAGEVYQKHYSVSGLFERLREDEARYPDTMDARFGAWAQLLALFRLIHDGGGHGGFRFPPRHGRLFNPDVYPFLEGRPVGSTRVMGAPIDPPRVPDGVVFRVLQNLLMLDGERLSYRALDVEQIGSVYEAMMGFALRQATGPSIAVRPKHIVINLADLLEQKPKDRAGWLQKQAELKVTGDALSRATTLDEAMGALGKKVSREYTPAPLAPGVMYLQPTEERRRSGSHYTPRSLTEPIVRTTFRPIFERLGDQATPEQILDLKVCDPAMGSGAFLVEACRLLAERLIRAWEVHKVVPKVPDDEDALTYAKRLVAERCLYGVDKNVFAVDLAKLSLWLTTLARDHPFTFLDHALRHGDSLVGLSREQIACFNWETDKQLPLLRSLIDERVQEAQRLREQIQGMAESDDVPEKARLLKQANEALDDVRQIGDLAVSAFFEREKPRDRHALRAKYSADVQSWLGSGAVVSGFSQTSRTDAPLTFHWEIEFPEVFTRANPGFDAFVGNPPFLGGNQISTVFGMRYFGWLSSYYSEAGGVCDLVAYFFRRAFDLVRSSGGFGLLATKTIGKGETRFGGLRWIRKHGGTIWSATRRISWPGSASVMVSAVHCLRSPAIDAPPSVLDGKRVAAISSYLLPGAVDDLPPSLEGQNELFSQGTNPRGIGFVICDDEPACAPLFELDSIQLNADEASRVWLYLTGEDINGNPHQTSQRYIICVDDIATEEVLQRLPNIYRILSERVRPERQLLSDNPNNDKLKKRWWAFHANRTAFYARIRRHSRCLVNTQVSNKVIFVFQPTDRVFALTLNVYDLDQDADFAVLQSRVHEIWAQTFGSFMKDDLRYTPSTCFETFPFPEDWETSQSLESAGREYYDFRAALMVCNNQGLTKTYNRFHDPDERDADIVTQRELHAAMDRAVLDAYGWTDIQPTCEFILDYEDEEDDETAGRPSRRKKPWRYRWPDEIRDEVLGRLLELNAKRAREEETRGTEKATASGKEPKRRTRASMTGQLPGLESD